MGLYIKGIDMPKKAMAIVVHPNGYAGCYDLKDNFLAETTAFEVPAHGRTIDADAFCDKIIDMIERQKYDDLYAQNLSVGDILREVVNELKGITLYRYKNAPTIIPPERQEKTMIVDKNGMCTLSEEDCSYHSCNTKQTNKITNADRVRSMTDEELANWLYDMISDFSDLVYAWEEKAPDCDRSCAGTTKTCRECWLNWLQKEA